MDTEESVIERAMLADSSGTSMRTLAITLGLLVQVATIPLVIVGLVTHVRSPMLSAPPTRSRSPTMPPTLASRPLLSGTLLTVEPAELTNLTPDQARASNAAVPFAAKEVVPPPFIYLGSRADRAGAKTCLTAAILYEAGDDEIGEQAVAQVVLNRLRHPAFPKTVCGVVFEGAERTTGCQFTFTCDGSLDRVPGPAAWARAEAVADQALSGFVFKAVGTATHYHTDWVVPYWRSSLTKVAAVHSHIFYRWQGAWGMASAFTGRYQPSEKIDPRIATLGGPEVAIQAATIPVQATIAAASLSIPGVPTPALKGNVVRLKNDVKAQYVLQLDPSAFPGSFAVVGFTICADRPDCLVMGWTEPRALPQALPLSADAMQNMTFMYRKNRIPGQTGSYWNCHQTPRADPTQCLPGTQPQTPPAPVSRSP
jgi:spore germination cell wall hydrolase CwlJ-like protein